MSKALSRICLTVVMPASGRKKPKWSGKSAIGAGDRLAARQVLGLEVVAVGREDELRLGLGGRRAGLQRGERLRDLARRRRRRYGCCWSEGRRPGRTCWCACAQPLDRRFLVPEGLQEGERKLAGVERLLGERRYGLFDLNGVLFIGQLSDRVVAIARPPTCILEKLVDLMRVKISLVTRSARNASRRGLLRSASPQATRERLQMPRKLAATLIRGIPRGYLTSAKCAHSTLNVLILW